MNLFDSEERLRKYANVQDIMSEFYRVRLATYANRKEHQLATLREVLRKLKNKLVYIRAILEDKLDLRKKKYETIVEELIALGIDSYDGYHYLTKMSMDSVSYEKVEELEKDHRNAIQKMEELEKTSIESIWTSELMQLKKCITR